MERDERDEKIRRPYEKPTLRIIELASEEVMSVGCKTNSGGFAVGSQICTFRSCAGAGS